MKEPGLDHLSPKSQPSPLSPLCPFLAKPQLPQPNSPPDVNWACFFTLTPFQCPSSFKAPCDPPSPRNHSWQPLVQVASWHVCSVHGSLDLGCCVLMLVSREHTLLLAHFSTFCPAGALLVGGGRDRAVACPPWFSLKPLEAFSLFFTSLLISLCYRSGFIHLLSGVLGLG